MGNSASITCALCSLMSSPFFDSFPFLSLVCLPAREQARTLEVMSADTFAMEMDEILQHELDGLHADLIQDCMCDHPSDTVMQDDGALALVGQDVREHLCSQAQLLPDIVNSLGALLVSSDPMVSLQAFLTVMQLDRDAFPDRNHPMDALAFPLCQVLQGSKRKEALRGALSSAYFSCGELGTSRSPRTQHPLKCASFLPLCPSHIHIRTGHTIEECFFAYHSESDSDMEAENPAPGGVYFDEL